MFMVLPERGVVWIRDYRLPRELFLERVGGSTRRGVVQLPAVREVLYNSLVHIFPRYLPYTRRTLGYTTELCPVILLHRGAGVNRGQESK